MVIPATFAGKPVISIAGYAFSKNANITSVTIPENVATIYARSFLDCNGLTSITIPASVTKIDYDAFRDCAKLNSVTFRGKVTDIQNSSFPGDLASKHKDGGAGIYTRQAGNTWKKQSDITAPGQPTLDKLTFAESKEGNLNGYQVKQGSDKISGDVVIPATFAGKPVISIAGYAFSKNANITSVIIPEYVSTIYARSFLDCNGLTSITIPASVTKIDYDAFRDCANLNSVTFRGKVTSIQDSSFPGDLAARHKAGGAGIYTRKAGSNTWEKNN